MKLRTAYYTVCYAALALGLVSCNSHTEPNADNNQTEIKTDNSQEELETEDTQEAPETEDTQEEPEADKGQEDPGAQQSQAIIKAHWMQGHWGISYRIPGGDTAYSGSVVADYQVTAAVDKIASFPGLKWVQLNLTNGAFGDRFIVPVAEVEAVNPLSAPNSVNDLYDPTLPGSDLFGQIALALQDKGIKVIAYIATQGPAMLKHGADKAMDLDDSIANCKSTRPTVSDPDTQVYCSENMNRWRDHVLANYPATSLHRSFELAMVNIVETLSLRYANLIDGWWFDHATYGDIDLLHAAALAGNSDAAVSFNQGEKVPLSNNPDIMEDYTFGHPTPLVNSVSSDDKNLPMLTSIEATANGVFVGSEGDTDSLGHMFMPLQQAWNGGTVVFSETKGSDWLNRALKAGGALTWALSQEGSTANGEARVISEPQAKLLRRMQFNRAQQLHLNLDGADGTTAYDDSVNQDTATLNGVTFVNDGARGKVASFTQTDQLILDNYKGISGKSARTTMAWIKTSGAQGSIINWGANATAEHWGLSLDNGKLKLSLEGSDVTGTTALNDNEWHHLAVVAADNVVDNIRVYIDGVLENVNVNNDASATFNTQLSSNVEIGGQFTGLIDKVTVHQRALAVSEIEYIALDDDADLDLEHALHLRFNETAGNTAEDSSIYARSATNKNVIVGGYDSFRDSEVYAFDGDSTVTNKGYNGVNGSDSRTTMAWIRAENGNGIIAKWGNASVVDGQQYVVRVKGNALRLSVTGGTLTGTTNLNDGQWHHIAVVSPDNQLANAKLYVDGQLETTTLGGTQTTFDTEATDGKGINVEIGSGFIGAMDEVIIHQRPLKLFEIKAIAGLQ